MAHLPRPSLILLIVSTQRQTARLIMRSCVDIKYEVLQGSNESMTERDLRGVS